MRKYKGYIYRGDLDDTYFRNDPRTMRDLFGLPDGPTEFIANGEMADGSLTYQIAEDYEKRYGDRPNGVCIQFQRDRHNTFYILSVDYAYLAK